MRLLENILTSFRCLYVLFIKWSILAKKLKSDFEFYYLFKSLFNDNFGYEQRSIL